MTSSTLEDGVPSDVGSTSIARKQSPSADVSSILDAAGALAAQTALLGGLLYYFGWARAEAALAYFGLDTNLVGYSFSDYLLRSIKIIFLPFIIVSFASLFFLGIHRFVVQRALAIPPGTELCSWASDSSL